MRRTVRRSTDKTGIRKREGQQPHTVGGLKNAKTLQSRR